MRLCHLWPGRVDRPQQYRMTRLNRPPDLLHCLVNGQPAESVSAHDRGFCYGDGLFETMRVLQGRIPLLERHLARLRQGSARLSIPLDEALVRSEIGQICQLLECDGAANAVLRLTLSRGAGGRGYRPSPVLAPTRVLSCSAYQPREDARAGISVRLCRTPVAISPALAGLKHCGRLEQVLARMEWDDPALAEGLMLCPEGWLIEGTMSNLFMVSGKRLLTPQLNRAGVAGVMREWLLEVADQQGLELHIGQFTPSDMLAADEVFVCNSVIGIWPVTALDQQRWCVGPVTRQLQGLVDGLFE